MIVKPQKVFVRACPNNYKRYLDMGKIPNNDMAFEVDVDELTPGSNVKVLVECDYCPDEKKNTFHMKYSDYIKNVVKAPKVKKAVCERCTHLKVIESAAIRYNNTEKQKKLKKRTLIVPEFESKRVEEYLQEVSLKLINKQKVEYFYEEFSGIRSANTIYIIGRKDFKIPLDDYLNFHLSKALFVLNHKEYTWCEIDLQNSCFKTEFFSLPISLGYLQTIKEDLYA
ncbi:hypothetical protein CON65_20415 [Bacillus pseudomycoides]|uniref:Uncharacterized protein n=1 Tax=Bacillus pseudomycoides TaxID=64104 RepID=A0AA91ZRR4_9BACI|nr:MULTISPECIES: hypothetical protein [Bacillus]PEB50411.1 hypothetical protein COO03_22360 [Bacillus sp. AFS098217]PED80861.1 hypothetical protein CON65_20415 [Bacillus pseudomycoides]PEU11307.1 hypothetical protein CN525_22485 [Bacillus sp. AFS014408]PFW57976.1 hypothetical protein COL20_25760 [Bacillus sp. AFS075034]